MTEVEDRAKTDADVALSEGGKQTPTYTQEQLEQAKRDARSSVLADANRFKVEAEKALRAAQSARERLEQMERERQQAELDAARDEPEKLAIIRIRNEARQKESELAKVREELNDKEAKLAEYTAKDQEAAKQRIAKEIAARLNVDTATMVKLAKFTDGTAEAIEEIAKTLPKINTPSNNLKPDSNSSHGGGTKTVTDVRTEYAQGKINALQYAEQMKALGKQP